MGDDARAAMKGPLLRKEQSITGLSRASKNESSIPEENAVGLPDKQPTSMFFSEKGHLSKA